LSESDRERLRTAQEEITKRTREQIDQIQREAQAEILGTVLSADQIEKLKGKPFTFEADAGPRFGPGPDRGGRASEGRPNRPDDSNSDDNDSGRRRNRRRGS
jgi:hypothetical protein